MVTGVDITGFKKGLDWAKLEERVGSQQADLYYPSLDLAIEVDTGSETHKTLKNKIKGYNRSQVDKLIFVTSGGLNRVDLWKDSISSYIRFIGGAYSDIEKIMEMVV